MRLASDCCIPDGAGWSQGRSWVTPSLLFERGNFVLDVVSPDLNFGTAVPNLPRVARVQERLRGGLAVSSHEAHRDDWRYGPINALADRDEAFNTRLGSMRGWQMAIERAIP